MNKLAEYVPSDDCPAWVAEANAQLCRCRRRAGHAVALRVLDGRLESVGEASQFVRALLAGNPLKDDMVAVVSELVANAARHSASGGDGGTVLLSLRMAGVAVRIAITDDGGLRSLGHRSPPTGNSRRVGWGWRLSRSWPNGPGGVGTSPDVRSG